MIYSLSKSTFIRYLQCEKSLFLYKKKKKLKDPISPEQQLIFDVGHSIGDLANDLFPGGVSCEWEYAYAPEDSLAKTKEEIQKNTPIIYEASFLADDTLIAIDILCKEGDGWHAYEVKSSTIMSETYLRDAALQYNIIKKSGLNITNFSIIVLNRAYVKRGDINIKELFKINNVLERVLEKQAFVKIGMDGAKKILNFIEEPSLKIGPHCQDPYPCDFQGYCWSAYKEKTVFQLEGMGEEQKWIFFNKGLINMKDLKDESLSIIQRISKRVNEMETAHIQKHSIQEFIDKIGVNYAFFDVLFARPALPFINETSPYQLIPGGFSVLHNDEQGKPSLFQYISENSDDLMIKFYAQLKNQLEKFDLLIFFKLGYYKDEIIAGLRKYANYEVPDGRIIDLYQIFENRFFWSPNQREESSLFELTNLFKIEIKNKEKISKVSQQIANKKMEEFLITNHPDLKEMVGNYLNFKVVAMYKILAYLEFVIKDNRSN